MLYPCVDNSTSIRDSYVLGEDSVEGILNNLQVKEDAMLENKHKASLEVLKKVAHCRHYFLHTCAIMDAVAE